MASAPESVLTSATMRRRTFLQALTATFAGLLTWGAPKIERVIALPKQILEVPKKVQRYFVETRYAERVITPVEEFEKVALGPTTIKRWDLSNPMMAVPVDVEVEPEYGYIVGRVLNPPGHRSVNIADRAAFDEAVKYDSAKYSELGGWEVEPWPEPSEQVATNYNYDDLAASLRATFPKKV